MTLIDKILGLLNRRKRRKFGLEFADVNASVRRKLEEALAREELGALVEAGAAALRAKKVEGHQHLERIASEVDRTLMEEFVAVTMVEGQKTYVLQTGEELLRHRERVAGWRMSQEMLDLILQRGIQAEQKLGETAKK